jgi:hypothetical protein
MLAEPTVAISAADPCDADAAARRQVPGRALHDFPDDLVAWDQLWPQSWQISFDNMQVGAAYAAGDYPQENVTRLKLGPGHFFHAERITRFVPNAFVNRCSHCRLTGGSS